MIRTNHDAAAVCRIAIFQKVVVGFLLLYLTSDELLTQFMLGVSSWLAE